MPKALHVEIELKYRLLGEGPIARLLMCLQEDIHKEIVPILLQQRNFFFDTKSHELRDADITFRIREENGSYTLTLKGPALEKVEHKHVSSRTELELPLHESLAKSFLDGSCAIVEWLMSFVLDEDEEAIQKRTFEHLTKKIANLELKEHIACVGSFTNLRQVVPIQILEIPLMLELDTTTFPQNVVHHELELELPPAFEVQAAESYVLTLFARAGVLYKNSSGKSDRFFKMLALGL